MNNTTTNFNQWKETRFITAFNAFVGSIVKNEWPSVPREYAPLELSPEPQLQSFVISDPCKREGGDFFMLAEKNGESVICVGDTMGHGTNAARHAEEMLRIISLTLKQVPAASPAYLLKYCNFLFHISNTRGSRFYEKTADLQIARLDHNNLTLEYSSANINLILLRDGKAERLQKDRSAVGNISDLKFDVNNHYLELEKGDLIFIHTDGIVDQFGGMQDKKLGSRKLIGFLETVGNLELPDIEKKLRKFIHDWKGGKEQTDDMTLIGIKI